MGKHVFTLADYDGETSTVTIPSPDLTDVNIVDELANAIDFQTALDNVSLGLITRRTTVAKISPQAVGRAADPAAQREAKALVRYHDGTTFEKFSMEIPAPDPDTMNVSHRKLYYVPGSGDNDANWTALVGEIEAHVAPNGNAVVVDEIIHVGRNL